MEEEIARAIKDAIFSAYLRLAFAIIKMAVRDVKSSFHTGHLPSATYIMANRGDSEALAFFASEGFLWLLQLIGCEPEDLERIAGRITTQTKER